MIVFLLAMGFSAHDSVSHAGVIPDMPNLCQLKVDRHLPGQGEAYCGPTATANVLLWMGEHGYPDVVPKGLSKRDRAASLVRELGIRMRTSVLVGTRPSFVVHGLQEYLDTKGFDRFRLHYEGHEDLVAPFSTAKRLPRLSSLRETTRGKRFAIVNVGWYDYDKKTGVFTRVGGHWLTLAGMQEHRNAPVAILHDPASATRPRVRFHKVNNGRIVGDAHRRSGSADGHYQLIGDLRPMGVPEANCALLDGVVYLEIGPKQQRMASLP